MNANADARQFNRKNAPGITIKEQPSTTATGDRRPETEKIWRVTIDLRGLRIKTR